MYQDVSGQRCRRSPNRHALWLPANQKKRCIGQYACESMRGWIDHHSTFMAFTKTESRNNPNILKHPQSPATSTQIENWSKLNSLIRARALLYSLTEALSVAQLAKSCAVGFGVLRLAVGSWHAADFQDRARSSSCRASAQSSYKLGGRCAVT